MYTIIATRKSGAHAVTVTDDEDLVQLIEQFYQTWTTVVRIETLFPNHQHRKILEWDKRGSWIVRPVNIMDKNHEEKS